MKKIVFIIICVLSLHAAYAQFSKESPVYYDENGNRVSLKEDAACYSVVEVLNEGYLVREYSLSGNLQMEALCEDYDPKLKLKGLKKVYHENGKIKEEGVFNNFDPAGIHKAYYSNGQLKTEVNHDVEKARYLHYYDSLGNDLLNGGNVIVTESSRVDKKTRSTWTNYVDIKNFEAIGTFSVSQVDNDTIYGLVEKQATYGEREGYADLTRDVKKELRYPGKAQILGKGGKVFVGFTVDKTGKLRNIHVIKGFYKPCDEEALRMVTTLKAWHPALHRNKPVSTRFVLPVVFTSR